MHLTLVSQKREGGHSGNVIAEVPGRDPKAPILLVGGHLDSWDLGTGAIDDGAGVAIATAAAKRIMDAGRPLRTIRVVWFGAEEPGGFGGEAYAKAHGNEPHYAIAGESDFGADRIWRFSTQADEDRDPAAYAQLTAALAPLGIAKNDKGDADGTDVEPTDRGRRAVDLAQPGRHPLFRLSPHAGRHARQDRSRRSFARTSPPGRRCSPFFPVELNREPKQPKRR